MRRVLVRSSDSSGGSVIIWRGKGKTKENMTSDVPPRKEKITK
jgi:hypothetical protein